MKLDRTAYRWALLVVFTVPTAARAQGFGLSEIGTCALSRGFAVTGAPCSDASLIYWNPGAATLLQGVSVYAGAAAIQFRGKFTNDISEIVEPGDVPTRIPPHAFVNYAYNARIALGLGVYVPYGLTSQFEPGFSGRFSALRTSIVSTYIQPNIAFAVVPGRLSIGGGPVWGRSRVEFEQALDLAPVPAAPFPFPFALLGVRPGTEFARARLEGDATAFGFNVGAHAQITPSLSFGLRYLSELKFEYDDATARFSQVPTGLILARENPFGLPPGTPVDFILQSQFSPPGPLTTQRVRSELSHPAQLQAGLGFTGLTGTTLSADFAVVFWNTFEEIPLTFLGANSGNSRVLIQDYENSYAVRAGVEHAFTQGVMGRRGFTGRAGFSYAKSPAPDETVTPLLPDMDRYNFSMGIGIPLGGRYVLDLAYLRLETEGRRGRIVDRNDRAQTAEELNSGFYSLNADVFSLSLRAGF